MFNGLRITELLNNKLQSSPVVEHADEETDEVDDGEWSKEEGNTNYTTVIDISENCFDFFWIKARVAGSEQVWGEQLTIGEVVEDEGGTIGSVVEEG